MLVVIPPPYQFCQVFSVYPSCTHQTDYGAIARVKRSSLSEKSTAVRQQRMGERERLPLGHRLLSPRFLCLLPHRENKLRRRATDTPFVRSSSIQSKNTGQELEHFFFSKSLSTPKERKAGTEEQTPRQRAQHNPFIGEEGRGGPAIFRIKSRRGRGREGGGGAIAIAIAIGGIKSIEREIEEMAAATTSRNKNKLVGR